MKLYEINYLVPQNIKESEAKETALKVESAIQEKSGILTQERKRKVIKLSSPVKEKKKVSLFTLRFQVKEGSLPEIRKEVEGLPRVLRVMIEKRKRPSFQKSRKKHKKRRKISKTEKGNKKTAKVELEKIEKKLDEILNESS